MLVLRADRLLDVVTGEYVEPGAVLVQDDRILDVSPASVPPEATVVDLGDLTLLPGLMDMELNMLMGGPSGRQSRARTCRTTRRSRPCAASSTAARRCCAGFTTCRNLGLFVRTGGALLDVALARAINAGWIAGPRIVAAGHAITPTGGHLDPTMFQRLGPGIMPLTVEEGIANGVPEVRKAVRYQLKYGAGVIKISASGGVMSHSGEAGAQQYSDEELAAIVDEAHRAGIRVAAHAHRRRRHPRLHPRRGRLHRARLTGHRRDHRADGRARHVPGADQLPVRRSRHSRAAPELKAKAAEVFPKARAMLGKAIQAGVKIACGTDAPAIPHGENAKELWAMVDRGMTPLQAIQAAT